MADSAATYRAISAVRPDPELVVFAFVLCAGVACLLTDVVRRYALRNAVLDHPNERSSHAAAVPRGGGLAIAVVFLAAVVAGWLFGVVPGPLALAVGVGGGLVAAVGWLDDHADLSAAVRAAVHTVAALLAVLALGGLPSLQTGLGALPLGIGGTILATVGIVWATNLYNFMDGIDGLAAGQAVTAGCMGGLLLWAAGDPGTAWLSLMVAAASAGFLAWNWAPARIFMGDVSSGMLGFIFATLAVASESRGSLPLLGWVLLLLVFLFDATVTLLRRVFRGERWYAAHRSHAYQRAVQSGLGHTTVTCAILALGVPLGALAWLSARHPVYLVPALSAAVLALAAVYGWLERCVLKERHAPGAGDDPTPQATGDAENLSRAGERFCRY